jgi:hypothetical protein
MEDLAGQFVNEMTSPRALLLLLLLLPLVLFLLLVRYARATTLLLVAKRTRDDHQQPADCQQSLPPSPPAVPVLGHLHLVVGSLPHVSLRSLARTHGADLMLLRLGSMPVLVAQRRRGRAAHARHVFASRPHSLVAEIVLCSPSDVGFAPHGDCWRRARKLVTTHLLSIRRVQSFRHAREEEVRTVTKIQG